MTAQVCQRVHNILDLLTGLPGHWVERPVLRHDKYPTVLNSGHEGFLKICTPNPGWVFVVKSQNHSLMWSKHSSIKSPSGLVNLIYFFDGVTGMAGIKKKKKSNKKITLIFKYTVIPMGLVKAPFLKIKQIFSPQNNCSEIQRGIFLTVSVWDNATSKKNHNNNCKAFTYFIRNKFVTVFILIQINSGKSLKLLTHPELQFELWHQLFSHLQGFRELWMVQDCCEGHFN